MVLNVANGRNKMIMRKQHMLSKWLFARANIKPDLITAIRDFSWTLQGVSAEFVWWMWQGQLQGIKNHPWNVQLDKILSIIGIREFEVLHVNQTISKMKQLFFKIHLYNTSSFTFIGLSHK